MEMHLTSLTFRVLVSVVLSLCLASCQQVPKNVNTNDLLYIAGKPFKIECSRESGALSNVSDELNISLRPNSKRCEIASFPIKIPQEITVEFEVELDEIPSKDNEWFSIFQVHSFPDKEFGEKWRCPVMALEVLNSKLRMYSRWDSSEVSDLVVGTCAHRENSISDRLVFDNYEIEEGNNISIKLRLMATYSNRGFLQLTINNNLIADIDGPNAFNDNKGIFIKLGAYKPTSWHQRDEIKLSYRKIMFSYPPYFF